MSIGRSTRRIGTKAHPARTGGARSGPQDAAGSVLGSVQLDPEWFGQEPNVALMHQVVVAQLAAARSGTQSTKTRAEVAGGGAKPFRQKGMGRSRQGSIRAPHWVGGGVRLRAEAPQLPPADAEEDDPPGTPVGAIGPGRSRACGARERLGIRDTEDEEAVAALASLGIGGRILIVLGQDDVVAERSFGNIPRIQTLQVGELNAYDVLRNDWIVFTDESLPGGVGDISSHKLPEDADAEIADAPEPRRQTPPTQQTPPTPPTKPDTETADTDAEDTIDAVSADDVTATVDGRRRRRGHRRRRRRQCRRKGRGDRIMRHSEHVLVRPVVSEKSYALMDDGVYVFIVADDASKIEIRAAVEDVFGVKVKKVNTLNRKGKTRRNRRTNTIGHRPDTKRAIITLAGNDRIDLFEKS